MNSFLKIKMSDPSRKLITDSSARFSEAQMGTNHEKDSGKKSRYIISLRKRSATGRKRERDLEGEREWGRKRKRERGWNKCLIHNCEAVLEYTMLQTRSCPPPSCIEREKDKEICFAA